MLAVLAVTHAVLAADPGDLVAERPTLEDGAVLVPGRATLAAAGADRVLGGPEAGAEEVPPARIGLAVVEAVGGRGIGQRDRRAAAVAPGALAEHVAVVAIGLVEAAEAVIGGGAARAGRQTGQNEGGEGGDSHRSDPFAAIVPLWDTTPTLCRSTRNL